MFRRQVSQVLFAVMFAFTSAAISGDSHADSTPVPLPETTPGDPAKGKKVFVARKKGNCLACHAVSELAEHLFHGEVGPPLDDIAGRMDEGELRFQVVDAQARNPDSIMPAYFRTEGLNRVLKKWRGKTILSAQEVEDIIAYLLTLKDD